MRNSPSLPSLLSNALSGLELSYKIHGAGNAGMPSLDLWANLLRVLREGGVDLREMPLLLRLSRRAVRTRISTAARRGWIAPTKPKGGKAILRLTSAGVLVADRWKTLEADAEQQWRARVGDECARSLRTLLERVVNALPLEYPHYPASYGPADASITGGNGGDWKAVPRENGNTTSGLPFSALVSEALVAFAMDYESISPVALSLSTSIIRRIPADGKPLRQFKDSAVGISALLRHGFLRTTIRQDDEIALLTNRGEEARDLFEHRIQQVESLWSTRIGDPFVATLRHALQALPNQEGYRSRYR